MSESINYQSILIISVLAFVTPIIINSIKKVKIPYVVGEIIVGFIVGKSFFNIVHDDSWVLFLSNLGLAYLMFLSGLEIDFGQLNSKSENRNNIKSLSVCVIMFAVSLAVSFITAKILFNLGVVHNIVFSAFLLSAAAPGLLVPLFKEKNLSGTVFGQTLLIFSLICEFICLTALTIISSAMNNGVSYKTFLFMVVIAAAVLLYVIAKKLTGSNRFSATNYQGLHMEVRASFAVLLTLVAISQAVGAEIAFGSFVAGIIFSVISGKAREDLKEKADIIGYGFLVPVFFIEAGVNINIRSVFSKPELLLIIPVILLIFYLVKFPSSLLLSRLFGIKKALSASFLLSAQLSLMIVGLQIALSLHIITSNIYSLSVFATVISCLLFPVLFDKTFSDENLVRIRSSQVDRICIREAVVTNASVFGKPLKDIKFPDGCRIFTIMRNGEELLPNGATVLQKGDILLMAGIKTNEGKMLNLVTGDDS